MKLPFYGGKIVEDVGMIHLKIVQYRGAATVMNELGALVEERGVVLVRLDDEEGLLPVARGHRKIERHAANEETRRTPSLLQDPGQHRGHRRLAMGTSHSKHVAAGEH